MEAPSQNTAATAHSEGSRLNRAAVEAMSGGDFPGAESTLLDALARDARNISAWLNLAVVRRQLGNIDGAFGALREALALDARNFHALLMSATLLEQLNHLKAAATAYGHALAQLPPAEYLDVATLRAVEHAREVHGQHLRSLDEFVRSEVADAQSQCTATERRRLDGFIATSLRLRPRYQQQPLEFCYPGLPSIEFYEREEFPWLAELEGATASMQQELVQIVREDAAGFTPYIHYPQHAPLDQWRELNHSPRWAAFHLFDRGRPIAERQARVPATMAALARLPQPEVALRSPTALFSQLQPRTRIPPHTGVANFRLVVHLPLVLPRGCGFRVGGETREWRIGEAWVFDDTIEHEAWNDSDETRIILICDVWSPRLSPTERAAIARVIAATDAFTGTQPETYR
jgi:aspartyl/asparaginyl beta-hydroxylase (cupin superfamily)